MENKHPHLETLEDIRGLMKRSSKFISLSGLSGVFAGSYALLGAFIAYRKLNQTNYEVYNQDYYSIGSFFRNYSFYLLDASLIFILSLATGVFLSYRKAKKEGRKLIDHTAWRLLFNLIVPLGAGGLFCLIMLYKNEVVYIAPCMLMFYGMALLNASKYTLSDIKYLGLCQIALGLLNALFVGHGLLFWSFGFGVLHVVYGLVMWNRYDRKKE